ncbi:pyrroline-5-carboxylate reductase [Sulfurimonas autotrophica]|uniref:Pyrroline-5-carboxylate reductase n=1 Tax=Sulfurimonas autotrophica (strain ATCC BAA-671 / DSM 16294 / JCM 11897 / OK10) TaxID=563040 RepID=E0UR55_SULAO|nr:pyrroline-5-carboxylate reductase [Sulfurimonas autotrophica]ADN08865.1 pyrroline-5-carboxylate reductase [Sulfurimonas autotrophica DSM 16294]
MKTITFIGNGNMALSIAEGLKENYKIEVVGRDSKKLDAFEQKLGLHVEKSLLDNYNIEQKTVMLCVKPANVEEVSAKLQGKAEILYSVLAGTSIEKLKNNFNTSAVVRAMPNLAASVGKSMTTLTGDTAYKEESQTLFSSIGTTRWLGSEKEIDIATALAGSGPAYLALIAESLTDGAVKQGLKRDDAMAIMRGLFDGFGTLIQDIHPALLKDGVMSPGGTTAAGYAALEQGNVRNACIEAIEKAYKKAVEL